MLKCDGCDVELLDVQTRMQFRALSAGQDWVEFPVEIEEFLVDTPEGLPVMRFRRSRKSRRGFNRII